MAPPLVSEPAYPLWALPAAVLTAGAWAAALPGSPAVALAGAAASGGNAGTALAIVLAGDAVFGLSIAAFYALASVYAARRHPGGGVKSYAGPWRDAKGTPHPPSCFAPGYLLVALTAAALAPAGGLALEVVKAGGVRKGGAATAIALLPYLSLWAWQWCLEMRLLRRE